MTKRHSKFYNRPDIHTPAADRGESEEREKPAFERRHYAKLAEALYNSRLVLEHDPSTLAGWRATTSAIARQLERDNPRFDRQRFLDAAGHTPPPSKL